MPRLALALVVAVVVLAVVGGAKSADCPGTLRSQPYVVSAASWPGAPLNAETSLAVGTYYENQSNYIWAVYNGPFALAAFNADDLVQGNPSSWVAAIRVDSPVVASLNDAQNIVVDPDRDSIIITTNSPNASVVILSRSKFIDGGTAGVAANSIVVKGKTDLEPCRGVITDLIAGDGSFYVGCHSNIYYCDASGVKQWEYSLSPLGLAANTYLWSLTVDQSKQYLWASADNSETRFFKFQMRPNLSYNGSLLLGGESRGIIYDPHYEELYAVKRSSPPELVRTKAYLPGFAFGQFDNTGITFMRPNGMVAVDRLQTIFVADTDPVSASVKNYTYFHMFRYQHAGCQCQNDKDCNTAIGETCYLGTCVSSPCQSCQIGTIDGSCAGGTCTSSTNPDSPVTVTFNGPTPQHDIIPNGDLSKRLNVLFETLEEVPSQGGLPVQHFSLLNQVFNIAGPFADQYTTENYVVSASTAYGDIQITFSLLNGTNSVDRVFGGISFEQSDETIKWTFQISNWPWTATTSTLLLRIRLLSADGNFVSASSANTQPHITTWTLDTANTEVQVNLLDFALADGGTSVPVTSDFYVGSTVLLLSFPYFAQNVTYDPDFGVLVTTKNGGDGDGTSTTLIIVLSVVIPVVIIPILLLIAILIAIYLFTYFRRRGLRHKRDSINTGSFEYAAEAAAADSDGVDL